jgi:hypothetical protein
MKNDQERSVFGSSVEIVQDLNGDGYADFAVGAFRYDMLATDEGQVYVWLGGASGPSLTPNVVIDNPLHELNGMFGGQIGH